jgi:hypothetical protein
MASVESQALDAASSKSPPVSIGGGDSFDNFLGQMSAKSEADQKELKSKTEPIIKDMESREPPKAPVLAEVPSEMTKQTSPLETFGSAAMWISTLGSMFTRQPFMNSLAATTGALNAAKQNDIEGFKRQVEQLKIHNENAEKAANFELETYKAALGKDKDAVSAYTAMFKNDTASTLAQAKMFDTYVKNMEKKTDDAFKHMPYRQWEASMKQEYPDFTPEDYFQNPAKYPDGPKLFQKMTSKSGQGVEAYKEKQEIKNAESVDSSIIKQAEHSGVKPEDLGKISPQNQVRVGAAYDSLHNIENISKYIAEHPQSVGLAADVARRVNLDGLKSLQTEEEKQVYLDGEIDKATQESLSSGRYSPDAVGQAKILNKMLATQAFNDAAASGSRGATIYLDKAFKEIYQQASTPETMFTLLHKRAEDADYQLKKYDLGIESRDDKDQFPFFTSGPETYMKDKFGKSGQQVLKSYSPEEYKKAKSDGSIKSGDHFLDSNGVEHVVQ